MAGLKLIINPLVLWVWLGFVMLMDLEPRCVFADRSDGKGNKSTNLIRALRVPLKKAAMAAVALLVLLGSFSSVLCRDGGDQTMHQSTERSELSDAASQRARARSAQDHRLHVRLWSSDAVSVRAALRPKSAASSRSSSTKDAAASRSSVTFSTSIGRVALRWCRKTLALTASRRFFGGHYRGGTCCAWGSGSTLGPAKAERRFCKTS